MVRKNPPLRNRTPLILVMASCVLIFISQGQIVSSPGTHDSSWALLTFDALLFAAAAVLYVRVGKGPRTPPNRS